MSQPSKAQENDLNWRMNYIGHLIFLAHGNEGSDFLCHPDDPLDGDVSHVDHADQVARFRRTLLA
jgi:hypothetical protein